MGEFADALRRARVDLEQHGRPRARADTGVEEDLELDEELPGELGGAEARPAATTRLAPELGERARALLDRLRGRELGMGLAFLAALAVAAPLLWVSGSRDRATTSVWLPREAEEGAALSLEQIERAVSEILVPDRLAGIADRHDLAPARIRAGLRVEPRWGPDPETGSETWWLQIAFDAASPDRSRAVERDVADLFVGPGLRFRSAPAASGPGRWRGLALAFVIALGVAAAVGLRPRRQAGPGVLPGSGSVG